MATPTKEPLVIPAEIYDAMVAHCTRASARACCGILGGSPPQASAIYPLGNVAANPRRYEADSSDLIRTAIDLRDRDLTIVAIYHYSPASPPIPSQTDLAENHYGDTPRVIVSLGKTISVRVWRLTAQSYDELDWRILRHKEGAGSEHHFGLMAAEQNASVRESSTSLRSILWRAVRWLRPSPSAPIARIGDSSSVGRDPMWDRSMDGS
jgi:[CysO sulfur-carrier protein]-S-L-cysteine hydrolase